MIKILSNWAKGLGVAIVVVSILEMLLPNNKTKKYVKMVMGIYILFNIISPFIQNKEIFDINNFNLNDYVETGSTIEVNQKSMDDRIQELYIEELEKDITNKLMLKGYEIEKCKVTAKIEDNKDESKVTKIRIIAKRKEDYNQDEINKNMKENEKVENKIVTEIQKIRKVDTSINVNNKEKTNQVSDEEQVDSKDSEDKKLSKIEIQNIKRFLIEEYGVSEKCLEIN